jgi:hypothetical protein
MKYLNLVVDSLNQELVQYRGNVTIGMNPITTKNNTIVILHLDDEECGSKKLASNGELHRDDASSLHRVTPTQLNVRLVFMSSSSSPLSFLNMEYGNATVDKHLGDRPSIDVTSNVQ